MQTGLCDDDGGPDGLPNSNGLPNTKKVYQSYHLNNFHKKKVSWNGINKNSSEKKIMEISTVKYRK